MIRRELTREERAGIRKLVTHTCANYDREVGCLPLDCGCFMLGKYWTGSYCSYFREAVLPLDLELEASLTGYTLPVRDVRVCGVCFKTFPMQGKKAYCSVNCSNEANRKKSRERMRKKRERKRP